MAGSAGDSGTNGGMRMKVKNPKFGGNGEVIGCKYCPMDRGDDSTLCKDWWYRNGKSSDLNCPTAETYAEACDLAEKVKA
jgi:hypothetical protein